MNFRPLYFGYTDAWRKRFGCYNQINYDQKRKHLKLYPMLTLLVTIPDKEKEFTLNFYFHNSLSSLKRFSEGLKGITRKRKLKFNLIFISIQLSEMHETGRVNNLILIPQLFQDGGRYLIETSPLICSANQWTGF